VRKAAGKTGRIESPRFDTKYRLNCREFATTFLPDAVTMRDTYLYQPTPPYQMVVDLRCLALI
jgi:hypothetical protein